jgi:hypothetical protein
MRTFLRAAATLVFASAMLAGPAYSARATAADCAGGANGFTDIPDDQQGANAYDVKTGLGDYNLDYLELEYGTVNGVTMGWALLENYGGPNSYLHPADQVWMDVSRDNGKTWLQCGPFQAGGNSVLSITTPAHPTSSDLRFRAGAGDSQGYVVVTPWW